MLFSKKALSCDRKKVRCRLEKYYWLYIRVKIRTCAFPKLMPMYLNVNSNLNHLISMFADKLNSSPKMASNDTSSNEEEENTTGIYSFMFSSVKFIFLMYFTFMYTI